jgi:methylaspartate ammonia-lyase
MVTRDQYRTSPYSPVLHAEYYGIIAETATN